MKHSALIWSTVLALHLSLQLGALAGSISYTPSTDNAPATMQGHLPVNKVGALLAADCLAILNGNEIKIQQNQNQDHDPKFKKSKPTDPDKPDLFKGEYSNPKSKALETTKQFQVLPISMVAPISKS